MNIQYDDLIKTIIDTSTDSIIVWDQQYRYLFANQAAIELLGIAPDRVLGRSIEEVVTDAPRFVDRWTRRIDQIFETRRAITLRDDDWINGRPIHGESRLTPILDQHGDIQAVCVIYRDISNEIQRDRNLRLAHYTIDHVNQSIFWVQPDGRFRLVNDHACRSLGYERRELLNRFIFDIDPGLTREKWREHWQTLKSKRTMTFETEQKPKNGGTFPVEVSANFMVFDGEELNVAYVRDISARRKAESRQAHTLFELRRMNRELNEITNAAAHDLREPLRSVVSFLQMLELDYGRSLDEKAQHYIDRAVKGARRMERVLDDLFRYMVLRGRHKTVKAINFEGLVNGITRSYIHRYSDRNVTIEVDSLPELVADPDQMELLFKELLDNAIIYSRDEPPRIEVSAEIIDEVCRFAVKDHGIGIDANYHERIFGIFRRLHRDDGYLGSGIGLTICQKIVEGHGGRIWVKSNEGEGATFYFELPVNPIHRDFDQP